MHARVEVDVSAPDTTGRSDGSVSVDGKTQEGENVSRTPVTNV